MSVSVNVWRKETIRKGANRPEFKRGANHPGLTLGAKRPSFKHVAKRLGAKPPGTNRLGAKRLWAKRPRNETVWARNDCKYFKQNLDSLWQKNIWTRPYTFHLAILTEILYVAYFIKGSGFFLQPV